MKSYLHLGTAAMAAIVVTLCTQALAAEPSRVVANSTFASGVSESVAGKDADAGDAKASPKQADAARDVCSKHDAEKTVGGRSNAGDKPGWKGKSPNSADTFRFVILSDRNGGCTPGIWKEAVRETNLLRPDFVMSVGDLISGASDPKELDRQWKEFDAIAHQLDAPFYYCAGNHDVSWPHSLKPYIDRHGVNGKSYYSFNRGGCHFVILDTTTALKDPQSADEQLAWLENDLAANKDTLHLFLFYHHPLWNNRSIWPRLKKLLDPASTTIFNGHWHELREAPPEAEIPTYVLSSTGGLISPHQREIGNFYMFAQVTVDHGKPTVALIPLYGVLSADYAAFAGATAEMVRPDLTAVAANGDTFTLTRTNTLTKPVEIETNWTAPGWKIEPGTARIRIEPGKSGSIKFALVPTSGKRTGLAAPLLTASYTVTDPVGRTSTFNVNQRFGVYHAASVPAIKDITLDGHLSDWPKCKPVVTDDPRCIMWEHDHWKGPADASYSVRLAHDAERLYVAVDVTDDDPNAGAARSHWNDSIAFFWDSRPAGAIRPIRADTNRHAWKPRISGPGGNGTGQVVMVLPVPGKQPAVKWYMGDLDVPRNFACAATRRKGGYVYEFSLPLKEMGVASSAAGTTFRAEVQLSDRDLGGSTFLSTSGRDDSNHNTAGYIRATLK